MVNLVSTAEPRPGDLTGTEVVERASRAAFGKPLVTNVLRAMLVEAMIDAVLPPVWRWCSADYAGWDFEHADGTRLEVKQSAARQSWATPGSAPSACSWDIAPRTGHWIGSTWVPVVGRLAPLYVLAHHPVADDHADHRDPHQWQFFVVSAAVLPETKRIALGRVQKLTTAVTFVQLPNAVEAARSGLNKPVSGSK